MGNPDRPVQKNYNTLKEIVAGIRARNQEGKSLRSRDVFKEDKRLCVRARFLFHNWGLAVCYVDPALEPLTKRSSKPIDWNPAVENKNSEPIIFSGNEMELLKILLNKEKAVIEKKIKKLNQSINPSKMCLSELNEYNRILTTINSIQDKFGGDNNV